MQKRIVSILIISFNLLLFSCGSSKKVEKKDPPPEPRRFTKDYALIDASRGLTPSWIEEPSSSETTKEKKKFRYFVSESEGSNKRLCMRSADARAAAKIAREIAQFIKNTYAEATQGGEDEDVSEYMQEQLAQEAQTFIVGAQTSKTYWEKRRYKVELGARSDETKYSCYALIKMSKRSLKKAIRNSRAKLLTSISNPEVKRKTAKAIQHVEDKFNELDKPVPLDD